MDDHRLDTLLPDLKQNYAGKLSVCRSHKSFCEMMNVSVSKWNAVKMLADDWGIIRMKSWPLGIRKTTSP